MIYFCADDYGVSKNSNNRIEKCIESGVLNKVSVMPNGEISDLKEHLLKKDVKVALHLNLIEGYPLSNPKDVSLLVTNTGQFKYSFIGLFFMSFSHKRRELKKQLYKEIKEQLVSWKTNVGEENPIIINSHQHTHMIPLVFKTLMRVIEEEGINVDRIRIPKEPIAPYVFTPSVYTSYTLSGFVKQCTLNFLALLNRRRIKKSKLDCTCFMGVMFSGRLTEDKLEKILPKYIKIAKKQGKDIEIGFHPGYLENDEKLIDGCQEGFKKFYFSKWRQKEYDALMNFKY